MFMINDYDIPIPALRSRLFNTNTAKGGHGYLSRRRVYVEPLERRQLLTAVATDLLDYWRRSDGQHLCNWFPVWRDC